MENMVDFGLQLYSINDYTKADMEYAFKRIQEFYYKFVEFAGFFDKSAEEIKGLLEEHLRHLVKSAKEQCDGEELKAITEAIEITVNLITN